MYTLRLGNINLTYHNILLHRAIIKRLISLKLKS